MHRREVRADQVVRVLRKDEPVAGGEFGRRRHDERPRLAGEVAERRPVEQNFVVIASGEIRPRERAEHHRRPVERIDEVGNERLLHVALEESRLEDLEQAFAVEAVRKRGKRAARDARDRIDLVQHPRFATGDDDRRAPQFLEHAVRECRSARAAPRECNQQKGLGIVLDDALEFDVDPVADQRIDLRDAHVGGSRRAAAREQHKNACNESDERPASARNARRGPLEPFKPRHQARQRMNSRMFRRRTLRNANRDVRLIRQG
jgi:hypothetical protein